MDNNWHEIWNNRVLDSSEKLNLEALIRLDGFDTGVAQISSSAWLDGVARMAEMIGIEDGESVFEFGCGSGAFLCALKEVRAIKGAGIDYSHSLIEIAKRALPEMHFTCEEAQNVSPDIEYDYCISHSVFHYFDMAYAEKVLGIMAAKARKAVIVLEIPDAETREAAETIRRDKLTQDEYEQKYAGLEHNYYPRKWFSDQAQKLNMACKFIENQIHYGQKDFRYGCILEK